jgi:hypothetical protein
MDQKFWGRLISVRRQTIMSSRESISLLEPLNFDESGVDRSRATHVPRLDRFIQVSNHHCVLLTLTPALPFTLVFAFPLVVLYFSARLFTLRVRLSFDVGGGGRFKRSDIILDSLRNQCHVIDALNCLVSKSAPPVARQRKRSKGSSATLK